jgi:hypothetical protein
MGIGLSSALGLGIKRIGSDNLRSQPWYVIFNGASSYIAGGSEASIVNLSDNAFTVEGWFRMAVDQAGIAYLISKRTGGSAGWYLRWQANLLRTEIFCATTSPLAVKAFTPTGVDHHIAITFDDAGDRKLRLFLDGGAPSVSGAADGAIVSDAAANLLFGSLLGTSNFLEGAMGWWRISNNIRYTDAFTPPSRSVYPAVDANTVRLFKMNEGEGTTINDSSANAQDATGVDTTWSRNP